MRKPKRPLQKPYFIPAKETTVFSGNEKDKTDPPLNIKIKSFQVDVIVQKLLLPSLSGFDYVRIDKLICCEADSSYTILHLDDNKKLMTSRSLKEFEHILFPYKFFRVHKSFLVNLERVSGFTKEDGGFVVMDNGKKIAVARRKKNEFFSNLLLPLIALVASFFV